MKIAFIHSRRTFLPELDAYQSFFQSKNIQSVVCRYGEEAASGADVYWYFMGIYPGAAARGKRIIHEYASASVPPYRKFKDLLKARLNPRPHFRLYLNEYVHQEIQHRDEIPFGYRDMGISDGFIPDPGAEKKYDFIYVGSFARERKIETLLRVFQEGVMKERSLLLLGQDYDRLASRYSSSGNIIFRGPVSRREMPAYLATARFAINFIPDREPFNAQTSTKFLEYAAMQIPIISSNYFWISHFRERYGGRYFFLKEDLSNLSWGLVSSFRYEFPKLQSWHWENQIRSSGILDYLQSVFPGISF
ncbi:MAG TPA: glycosyltransferase [Puia sp.]|jgi:glycosyltransferase involved in cell wall biosynthesis